MKRLWLLFLAFPVYAADIGATGVTCSLTIPASVTLDAGSNRKLFFSISSEVNTTPQGDVATVGGQAETETFVYTETSATQDHHHEVWIWDETAIAAMSGSSVSGTEGGSVNMFCWGVVTDAIQTALSAHTGTDYQASSATATVTTTSTANDFIFASAVRSTGTSATFDSWDTLTEDFDAAGGSQRLGAASGTGGDNSTVITMSSSSEITAAALVFANAAAADDDWLRQGRGR